MAAQTGLVLIRNERVARLHSHGTDLVVVPSCVVGALRALQGHRRHDRAARLRRRRAVPHRARYRSAIGRPVPGERCHVTGAAATLKDDFHLRCPSGLLATPSRNGERDSSNNRDTGNVGRGEKDRRKFRSRLETRPSLSTGRPSGRPLLSRLVGEYLHHRDPLLGPPTLPRGRYLLSTSSLSPSSLSECTAVSVTAWRTLAPLPGFRADRYGDGSRSAIRHGVLRRSVGLSIKRRRDYVVTVVICVLVVSIIETVVDL